MISFGDKFTGALLPTVITERNTVFQLEVSEKKNTVFFLIRIYRASWILSTCLWAPGLLDYEDLSFSGLLGKSGALETWGPLPAGRLELLIGKPKTVHFLTAFLPAASSHKGRCWAGASSGVPKHSESALIISLLICGVMTCLAHLSPPLARGSNHGSFIVVFLVSSTGLGT